MSFLNYCLHCFLLKSFSLRSKLQRLSIRILHCLNAREETISSVCVFKSNSVYDLAFKMKYTIDIHTERHSHKYKQIDGWAGCRGATMTTKQDTDINNWNDHLVAFCQWVKLQSTIMSVQTHNICGQRLYGSLIKDVCFRENCQPSSGEDISIFFFSGVLQMIHSGSVSATSWVTVVTVLTTIITVDTSS